MANEKIVKKRNRLTGQMPYGEGLTVEEGLQLVAQLDLLAEEVVVDSHAQVGCGSIRKNPHPLRIRSASSPQIAEMHTILTSNYPRGLDADLSFKKCKH
jgi:hypothetical protein